MTQFDKGDIIDFLEYITYNSEDDELFLTKGVHVSSNSRFVKDNNLNIIYFFKNGEEDVFDQITKDSHSRKVTIQ